MCVSEHVCVCVYGGRNRGVERERKHVCKMLKVVTSVEQNDQVIYRGEKSGWSQSSLQQYSVPEDCGTILKDLQGKKSVTQIFYIQPNYLSTIKITDSLEHERIQGISII